MKIDRLVVIPTLLIVVWAILAAGTIAMLAGLPIGAKAPVQKQPAAQEILVGDPARVPEEIHVAPLR